MYASPEFQHNKMIHITDHFCPDSASSASDDSHVVLHPMPKQQILQDICPFGVPPFPLSSSVPAHICQHTHDSRNLYLSSFNCLQYSIF